MRLMVVVSLFALGSCGERSLPVVDRLEGDVAVVVSADGGTHERPASGLREGDVLVDGRPDPAARRRQVSRVAALRARLSEGEPAEDLDL